MSKPNSYEIDEGLAHELEEARKRSESPLTKEEVKEIISEVLGSLGSNFSGDEIQLQSELEALAKYIETARSEISSINPDEIREQHIPSATDELDAIVGATEEATGAILDACEVIEDVAPHLAPEHADKLTEAVTSVYEACNFQDITGQRITKVVEALKQIEDKVDDLLAAFGDDVARERRKSVEASAPEEGAEKVVTDEDLLNGPQLPDKAIDQDEIDRLLASFD